MRNPFNYLQFAKGDYFYDRKEILHDLKSRFLSGQTNVVLYGPRRYGKSSLVAELASALEAEGLICITFDMIKMATLELFVEAYATKIYRRLAPLRLGLRQTADFFKHLRPNVSLSSEGELSFSVNSVEASISLDALSEVLDLPQRLAENRRILSIMDEFQEVEGLLPKRGFESVMRSVIQTHDNVSYIFLGSRHHMLRRMFTDHNRPFYKSALTMLLDKPPRQESVDFVCGRFASCGMAILEEDAQTLVEKVENIPYYIQQLGFEVFRLVEDEGRKRVSAEDIDAAYARLAGFNRDQYEQLMLTFSMAQKQLLIALAREQTQRFDLNYRKRHGLGASSTINSAKQKLIEDGHLEQVGEKCYHSDPFFAEYLRQ